MPELIIQPPEEVEEKNEGDTPSTKPMVGIIYPPPEVRSILPFLIFYVRQPEQRQHQHGQQ